MNRSIEVVIDSHRNWLDKNGLRIFERDSAYLREDMNEGSLQAFLTIPDSLNGLATYFGIRGSINLIDGKDCGWADISTAIDFCGWGVKIQAHLQNKGFSAADLTNHISRTACLVCISNKWGGLAEDLLRRFNNNPALVDQTYWRQRRFEPFVYQLCRLRDGEPVTTSATQKWPYGDVIRSWEDESTLVDALGRVCEYHCQHITDSGDDWDPEFKFPPFDLIPCEAVFIKRVRQHLGLPVPTPTHDLLSLFEFDREKIENGREHELVKDVKRLFEEINS